MVSGGFYNRFIKEPLTIAAAAVISLYLAQGLNFPQGYWAVMSSIIVLQTSAQETISAGLIRVMGTAVGAIIGGLFLSFYGSHVWVFVAAVTLVVFICLVLNLKQSYRLAGVTVAVILLINHPESPWMTAWHRFLEVSLGIIVALLMSLLMNPSYTYGLFREWTHRKL